MVAGTFHTTQSDEPIVKVESARDRILCVGDQGYPVKHAGQTPNVRG